MATCNYDINTETISYILTVFGAVSPTLNFGIAITNEICLSLRSTCDKRRVGPLQAGLPAFLRIRTITWYVLISLSEFCVFEVKKWLGAAALVVITSFVYWAGYAAEDKRIQKREANGMYRKLRPAGSFDEPSNVRSSSSF